MVKVIIIGTMGLDDIRTPSGEVQGVLGGSATYASWASSFFAKTGVVSIVGDDFPDEHHSILTDRGICLNGLVKKGKTFRWQGLYEFDMNEAKTLNTELNSVLEFEANLPEEYKKAEYVFLANIDPDLQLKVIEQLEKPKLIAMDTMNFWIDSKKEKLIEAIKKVDILVINDGEARQLFGTANLVKAGKKALELGIKAVIIKKGEHGALLFTKDTHFNAPGYPLEEVKDPTGCGDSFGGSFIGYLAKAGKLNDKTLKKAVIYATSVASHNAEGFSLENLKNISKKDIDNRVKEIKKIRKF
jgi:ribokinase